jgi:hypothetical protein
MMAKFCGETLEGVVGAGESYGRCHFTHFFDKDFTHSFIHKRRFGLDVGIHGLVLNWGVNTKTEDNSK